jgi:hypothetical protein
MTLPRGVYPLPQSRFKRRHQTSTSHCSRGRTWLASCYSENGAIKRPWNWAHSTGGVNRTTSEMKRYRRPQQNLQQLLGSVEVAALRNGILERNWESVDGRSTIAQIVIPRSKVKDLLTEVHDGPSGGHLGINKSLNKVGQRFYWLQVRADIEKLCRQCDNCAASRGPRTKNWDQMHQYNVGVPFEWIAIDVAGPFPRRDQGNRYLLIAMDYFTKWSEVFRHS